MSSSARSRMIWKNETLNLKKLEIQVSSCQCLTTLNGQRKDTKRIVFRIENGIPSLDKWCNGSRKQVTQSSQVPVS